MTTTATLRVPARPRTTTRGPAPTAPLRARMRPATVDRTFRALGTEVRLLVTARDAAALVAGAEREVRAYDARLSRFRPDSELCALNADPRAAVPASPLLREAVAAALWAAERTDGLVDPCLLDALEDAGYRASLASRGGRPAELPLPTGPGRPARPHPAARWRHVRVAGATVHRPPGLRLDLGGSGKGHVADRVARLLAGAERWVVDCGGDLRLGGAGVVHDVHVAHPLGGPPAARLRARDAAVAMSSIVARAWARADGRRAHHLLDPSTGEPAWSGLLAVTALAPTTLDAETVAKAALLSGADRARELLAPGGGILFHRDGTPEHVR
jgi:thiamine biosynthesis lipoprotein